MQFGCFRLISFVAAYISNMHVRKTDKECAMQLVRSADLMSFSPHKYIHTYIYSSFFYTILDAIVMFRSLNLIAREP